MLLHDWLLLARLPHFLRDCSPPLGGPGVSSFIPPLQVRALCALYVSPHLPFWARRFALWTHFFSLRGRAICVLDASFSAFFPLGLGVRALRRSLRILPFGAWRSDPRMSFSLTHRGLVRLSVSVALRFSRRGIFPFGAWRSAFWRSLRILPFGAWRSALCALRPFGCVCPASSP